MPLHITPFFGWEAPHAYFSVPVVLGTIGGLGLLIGPPGLYVLKLKRDTAIVDVKQDVMDVSFLALLFLTSVTGNAVTGTPRNSRDGTLCFGFILESFWACF